MYAALGTSALRGGWLQDSTASLHMMLSGAAEPQGCDQAAREQVQAGMRSSPGGSWGLIWAKDPRRGGEDSVPVALQRRGVPAQEEAPVVGVPAAAPGPEEPRLLDRR